MAHKSKLFPVYLLLIGIAGYTIKYVLNSFLANHMPESYFGDFSVALKTLNISATVLLLGTNISAISYLASYLQGGENQKARLYISWSFKLLGVSTVYLLLSLLALLLVMVSLHFYDIQHIGNYHLTVYLLWLTPLIAAFLLLASYILSWNKPVIATIIKDIARYTVVLGFFVVTVKLLNVPFNTAHLTIVLFSAFIMLVMTELLILKRSGFLDKRLFNNIFQPRERVHNADDWFGSSVKLFIANSAFLMIDMVDLIAVEVMMPGEASVGYYAAAITIGTFVFIIPDNMLNIIKPEIKSALATSAISHSFKKYFHKMTMMTAVATILISGGLIALSDFLLSTFGEEYSKAGTILVILVVAYAINVFAAMPSLLLTYGGQESAIFKITILELLIAIIAAFTLTYFYGLSGTAFSMVIASIFRLIVASTNVRLKFGLKSLIVM